MASTAPGFSVESAPMAMITHRASTLIGPSLQDIDGFVTIFSKESAKFGCIFVALMARFK